MSRFATRPDSLSVHALSHPLETPRRSHLSIRVVLHALVLSVAIALPKGASAQVPLGYDPVPIGDLPDPSDLEGVRTSGMCVIDSDDTVSLEGEGGERILLYLFSNNSPARPSDQIPLWELPGQAPIRCLCETVEAPTFFGYYSSADAGLDFKGVLYAEYAEYAEETDPECGA